MMTPPLTSPLTMGLRFFLAVDRMPRFLNEWTLPQSCLNVLTMQQLAFPQRLIGEKERETERENNGERREEAEAIMPSILQPRK